MATRGTEFIGTALLEEVAANYDRRVADINAEIDGMMALSTSERHAAWRHQALQSFMDVAERIERGPVPTDAELSGFKVKSPPAPDDFKYSIQHKESDVERLLKAKDKALAYIRALAADKDGVVTLAAADLRRIGYAP